MLQYIEDSYITRIKMKLTRHIDRSMLIQYLYDEDRNIYKHKITTLKLFTRTLTTGYSKAVYAGATPSELEEWCEILRVVHNPRTRPRVVYMWPLYEHGVFSICFDDTIAYSDRHWILWFRR